MPNVTASRCWSASTNCSSTGASGISSVGMAFLCWGIFRIEILVVVGLTRHDGNLGEIVLGWRRGRLPFETGGAPGVWWGFRSPNQRIQKVGGRQKVTEGQDTRSECRADVEEMKLLGIKGVSSRHAHVAEKKLGKEGQIEADENDDRCETRRHFRVEPAGHLGPPVMQRSEIAHDHSADHDVMEMGDDEIGVVKMNVHGE